MNIANDERIALCLSESYFGTMGSGDIGRVFEGLLHALEAETARTYGDRLVSLVVFGSVGRGTFNSESDIDFLIVATELPRGRMARVTEFSERVERALESRLADAADRGVSTRLSPLFKSPGEVRLGGLIFLDMVDDARILVDRRSFFANFLSDLRARLIQLGSKRVFSGNRWYWVLKPDFKPGEVFEI